jgi:ABC-type Fe3+-hydroxamate transport system substrate-binding protein
MRRALLVLLHAVVAGCGSGDEPAGAPTASGDGAFPARVEHKFGSTTVPERPSRIVVVGLTEQDTVLRYALERLTPMLEDAVAGRAPRKVASAPQSE